MNFELELPIINNFRHLFLIMRDIDYVNICLKKTPTFNFLIPSFPSDLLVTLMLHWTCTVSALFEN